MAVFWPVFTPFREVIRQKKPRNRSLGAYIVAYLSNHHERYGAWSLIEWVTTWRILSFVCPFIGFGHWVEWEQEVAEVGSQFLILVREDYDSGLVLILILERVSLPNCELRKSAIISALTLHCRKIWMLLTINIKMQKVYQSLIFRPIWQHFIEKYS